MSPLRAQPIPGLPKSAGLCCAIISRKHTQWELNAMAKDHTADTSKMKRKAYEKELRKLQILGLSLLPSTHAGRNTFVEVCRVHDGLDTAKLQILSDNIAHTGESDGDALAL